jgi:hypothetical protein
MFSSHLSSHKNTHSLRALRVDRNRGLFICSNSNSARCPGSVCRKKRAGTVDICMSKRAVVGGLGSEKERETFTAARQFTLA